MIPAVKTVLVLLIVCCISALQATTIKGQILPSKEGEMPTKIYFKSFTLSNTYLLDSATLNNYGSFELNINVNNPTLYYIISGKNRYKILLTPNESELRVTLQNQSKDKLTFENSKENDAYKAFKQAADLYDREIFEIYKSDLNIDSTNTLLRFTLKGLARNINQIQSYFPNTHAELVLSKTKQFTLSPEIETSNNLRLFIKNNFLTSLPFENEYLLEEPTFDDVYMGFVANLLDTSSSEILSFLDWLDNKKNVPEKVYRYCQRQLFQFYIISQNEKALSVFLSKAMSNPRNAENILLITQMREVNEIMPGKVVNEIIGIDQLGKTQRLSEISKKAKLTLLFFWEPSCKHCLEAIPRVKLLYNLYSKKGLQVFGYSATDEVDKWKQFLSLEKINWISTIADSTDKGKSPSSSYFVMYTPTYILINSKGEIVHRFMTIKEIEQIIKSQL
jgi:peroxiredoxin